MKYIAHRGLWNEKSEQNTFAAIKKSLDSGFGVELDVRDRNGELVVSHDPSEGPTVLFFKEVVDLFRNYESVLAINIKTDGILANLESALDGVDETKYFLFDMSIPETIGYLKSELTTFMRISEYENTSELHKSAEGVWLDAFNTDWWLENSEILNSGTKICVVSPELHGRDKSEVWNFLKHEQNSPGLYICTDYPELAKAFFE
jgi:glycerophosphoryl diester phosphodiesterase